MISLSVWMHYIRHLQIIGETILTQHKWLSLMACLKNVYSRWMTWWIYCEPCLCVIAGLKSRLLHFILGHFMNNSQRLLNGFRPDTPTCNLAELGYECTEFRHWSTSVRVFYHIFHILQWHNSIKWTGHGHVSGSLGRDGPEQNQISHDWTESKQMVHAHFYLSR